MEPNHTVNQSSSSSSETNKKKRNYRNRPKNKKPDNADASTSEDTKKTEKIEKAVKTPLKGFKKIVKDQEEDDSAEGCFICTRPIEFFAVGPCNHRTCHLCTLRLRVLYKTKNCAYCKAESKRVIFTTDAEKLYDDYKREDTPFYDPKYGIRFETETMYQDTMVLLQHNCAEPDCEEAFENWQELKRHIKQVHKRNCCDLCIRNKKIFAHEHTLYTKDQLQKHNLQGDASFNKEDETGFSGHPECVFCQSRFYSADELFEHCRDKHEQCHLCLKKGIQRQYYANYDSLEKHFKQDHYLCIYKECLDNKFVVFDSDIDLKAHEVETHGNGLSRQQRAKQSEARRVDVNLNYGQSRNGSGSSSNRQQQQQSQSIRLTAEDFPDMNGSTRTSPSFLNARLGSLQLTEQDHWPTLGEDNNTSGRSSPANESDTGIVSRHAAALDGIADMLKNFSKVVKFRQLTTAFTSLSIDTDTYVNSVYDLCDKDAEFTAKVLKSAKDLVDNRTLKSEMVRTWNQKKNPREESPRVLVVNAPNGKRTANQKKKAGVWDKVASAAVDAGAVRPTFPPLAQSTTPWSGSSTPRNTSHNDLQQLFPALPTATSSRRADINAMLNKSNVNAWGETSSTNTTETEDSDVNTANRKKKGKKGKQVLFRVGL
ncbi:hypothetical protein MFLAVUS_005310 [Mucor flavus]|uniref:RING-type E3 ubiquitin transferase n=1 Tax=Mucor flavus TaxID=439312 RepID=A0ABP9YYE6_9FUNG